MFWDLPSFQAGHAGSIPVTRSAIRPGQWLRGAACLGPIGRVVQIACKYQRGRPGKNGHPAAFVAVAIRRQSAGFSGHRRQGASPAQVPRAWALRVVRRVAGDAPDRVSQRESCRPGWGNPSPQRRLRCQLAPARQDELFISGDAGRATFSRPDTCPKRANWPPRLISSDGNFRRSEPPFEAPPLTARARSWPLTRARRRHGGPRRRTRMIHGRSL